MAEDCDVREAHDENEKPDGLTDRKQLKPE